MKYRTGEDFDAGGKFLSLPGCYHFVVAFVRDPAANNDGAPIPGCLFNVGLAVLAGGDGNQKDKTIDLKFFEPSMDAKDGGKFQRKKIDRFLLATSLITEDDADKEAEIEMGKCVGRQLCIKLEGTKYKDKKGTERDGLEVHFCDIYHVDDPEVATWDRNVKSLEMIPKRLRKIPAVGKSTAEAAAAATTESKPAPDVDKLDI